MKPSKTMGDTLSEEKDDTEGLGAQREEKRRAAIRKLLLLINALEKALTIAIKKARPNDPLLVEQFKQHNQKITDNQNLISYPHISSESTNTSSGGTLFSYKLPMPNDISECLQSFRQMSENDFSPAAPRVIQMYVILNDIFHTEINFAGAQHCIIPISMMIEHLEQQFDFYIFCNQKGWLAANFVKEFSDCLLALFPTKIIVTNAIKGGLSGEEEEKLPDSDGITEYGIVPNIEEKIDRNMKRLADLANKMEKVVGDLLRGEQRHATITRTMVGILSNSNKFPPATAATNTESKESKESEEANAKIARIIADYEPDPIVRRTPH